jgi:hypothetical protein
MGTVPVFRRRSDVVYGVTTTSTSSAPTSFFLSVATSQIE